MERVDERSTFDVQKPRSYAGGPWEFLVDASSESRCARSQGGVDGVDHALATDP